MVQLEGIEASPAQWERDLVAPRLSTWRASWLDELVKTGQVTWMGRGVKNSSIQVALFATPHVELLAPPPDDLPDDPDCHVLVDWLGQRGASFVRDIVQGTGIPHERTLMALKTIYQVPEQELDDIDEAIVAEMDAAYEFADKAPAPPPEARFENVMAEGPYYGDSATTRPSTSCVAL